MTEAKKPATKNNAPPPVNEVEALANFRAHVQALRAMGACQVTASFGTDIVFTATFPEDQEPHGVH